MEINTIRNLLTLNFFEIKEDWKERTEFYHKHLLGPFVYHKLKELQSNGDIPDEARDQFKKEYYATVVSNLKKVGAATKIFQELRKINVLVIPLKGISLLETAYKDVSVRPMTDIDILIKPEDIQTAKSVLEGLGYQYFESYRGSYNFNDPQNRMMIDVHTKFTRYEQLFRIDYAEIYNRLTRITFNNQVQVHILCPEHQVAHICLHLAPGLYSDYNLINFLDLHNLISEYPIDWEYLVEFAQRTKTASYLYAPIYLCAQLYQLDIPEFVLTKLGERLTQKKMQHIQNQHLASIINKGADGSNMFLERLAWAEGPSSRIKLLRASLFPDREEMAKRYNIPETSPKIYALYLTRLWKLLTSAKR